MDNQNSINPTPPTVVASNPSTRGLFFFLSRIIMILIILGIAAFLVFVLINRLAFNQLLLYLPAQSESHSKPQTSFGGVVTIPENLSDPSLRQFAVTYSFLAVVKELKQTPQGREIVTNLKDPAIPRFIINESDTDFYFGSDHQSNQGMATAGDLKPGSNIKLVMMYYFHAVKHFKPNEWVLRQVFIPKEGAN